MNNSNKEFEKFVPLSDFKPKQQQQLKRLLSQQELGNSDIKIFARVIEKHITITDDVDKQTLWNTDIIIAAFLVTDLYGNTLDKFIVPANPFRIRIDAEYNDLISLLDEQFESIQEETVNGDA